MLLQISVTTNAKAACSTAPLRAQLGTTPHCVLFADSGVAGAVESGAVKKRDVEALVDHDILELMYEASPNNEARSVIGMVLLADIFPKGCRQCDMQLYVSALTRHSAYVH